MKAEMSRKIMKELLIFFSTLIFAVCCVMEPKPDNRTITFQNHTDKVLYYWLSQTDSLDMPVFENSDTSYMNYYKIIPNSKFKISISSRGNWNFYINNSQEFKMRLFIIKQDTVNKYGWKFVAKNHVYSKMLKINIEDLEKNNWTIVYNGE